MDYEQMEIDITLESDRDLKENMQATAKFALGQIMEYQHPTKVKTAMRDTASQQRDMRPCRAR